MLSRRKLLAFLGLAPIAAPAIAKAASAGQRVAPAGHTITVDADRYFVGLRAGDAQPITSVECQIDAINGTLTQSATEPSCIFQSIVIEHPSLPHPMRYYGTCVLGDVPPDATIRIA